MQTFIPTLKSRGSGGSNVPRYSSSDARKGVETGSFYIMMCRTVNSRSLFLNNFENVLSKYVTLAVGKFYRILLN